MDGGLHKFGSVKAFENINIAFFVKALELL